MLDKKVFIILFLFVLNASFACDVVTSNTLIRVTRLDNSAVKTSNCPLNRSEKIHKLFNEASGVISSTQLSNLLGFKVNLTPRLVRIYEANKLLKSLIGTDYNTEFVNTRGLNLNSKYIASNLRSIDIECSNKCKQDGTKNIKLILSNSTDKEEYWISTKVAKKSKVYVLNRDVDVHNTSLNVGVLSKKFKIIEDHLAYFDDVRNIHFYKPNKKIKRDEPLLRTDLTPIKLVKPGHKVKVLLKAKNLTLKATGVARQSGNFEDFIDVYNPSSKKKYTGKIVDFNTVMVDL